MLCGPTSPITSLSERDEKKVHPIKQTPRGDSTTLKYLILVLLVAVAPFAGCGGGGDAGEQASVTTPETGERSSSYQIQTGHPLYSLTVLGDLGVDNWAVSLNESGQIAGNYQDADGSTHVFLWDSGTMTTLVDSAQASAINAAGEVVGWLEEAGSQMAFLHDGQLQQLGLPTQVSKAYAINDLAQIVGLQITARRQAFLDDGGRMDVIAPDITGYAARLNNVGQILLQQETDTGSRALIWENGTLTDLGTLGGDSTHATDINDAGQMVGWSLTAESEYHAFLWQNGMMTDLAEAFGGTFCSAVAINEQGQVLIKSSTIGQNQALIWDNGEVTDLGNLGVEYAVVNDLNDAGEIVGWLLTESGEMRGFLAAPRN